MEVGKARSARAVVLVGHVTKDGASRGRGCWSTWSTACSCSRASGSEASGPFGRSRTASGRPARWACSRCAPAAWWRWPTPRRASSARRAGRPARACSARWRAPARCWSRSRPSWRPPRAFRRAGSPPGIDRNRLAMIIAVLARHGGPSLAAADVFVNVAGGVRVDEPGADLAVALALASAHRGEPLARLERPAARLLRRGGPDGRASIRRPPRAASRRGRASSDSAPCSAPRRAERIDGLEGSATLAPALRRGLGQPRSPCRLSAAQPRPDPGPAGPRRAPGA